MLELLILVGGLVAILLVNRRFESQDRRIHALEQALLAALPSRDPALPTAALGTQVDPADASLGAAEPGAGEGAGTEPPPAKRRPPPPPPPRAPAASDGFEDALGSRWAVWVGGVALALGGIFLVRYSIEQGLIGPGLRVALGLLFALALGAAGEWLRRRETPLSLAAIPSANIPAILTAAGTSTAFATVYAAYGLYGLIGPALAFVLLGHVSLVAMAAALLHGPALGALGLVAALGAPLLVESRDPSPVALVLYLAFAVGAAYGVARVRLWRWLAIAALVGAWLWGAALLVSGADWLSGVLIHIIVQLALAILFLVVDPHRDEPDDVAVTDRMVAIGLAGFGLLAAFASSDLGAGWSRPVFIGLVAAMMMASAFRFPAAASGLAAAAITIVAGLAEWPVAVEAALEPERLVRDLPSAPRPEAVTAFLTTALVLGGGLLAAGLARLALGRDLRIGPAGWYAGAATLGPLAILVVAYWRVTAFDGSVPFAIAAAILGAAYAAAAGRLMRLDPPGESFAIRLAVGASASAAVAALATGLVFALDRGVLTVALSLAALGTAYVAERIGVPALRWAVGALGLAVAARLAWDPSIMRGEIGTTPIFNWLLWGYGVPALAFGLATRILARRGRDGLVRFVESLSIIFAALLVFLQIRHALHAGAPFTTRSNHLEAGLVVTEALAFTLLAVRLDLRSPDILYRIVSLAFGAAALAGAAAALGFLYNPYLTGERILGGAVFNSLLPAYLIPAALAGAVAWASRSNRPRAFVLAAAALALVLELAFSFLEVRRLFQGERIGLFRPTSQAELWCYSLVLLANGIGLLAAGIVFRSRVARLASAACIVAAVAKVFIVDLSALEGLARALSFVGLGLVLVAIGFVYQRLLAQRPVPPG